MRKKKQPFMPIGTALWLKENAKKLTMKQIADFCCMNEMEVEELDNSRGFPCDPIEIGQLTQKNISDCEADSNKKLVLSCEVPVQSRKGRYLAKYQKDNFLNCIAWMKENTDCTDKEIGELFGKTERYIKTFVEKLVGDTEPKHPVQYSLCTMEELREYIKK